ETSNYMGIIKAKKTEDFLDRNLIALLTSDPKFFRYKGFRSIVALYKTCGENAPEGLGAMVGKEGVEKFVFEENSSSDTTIVLQQNYSLKDARENLISAINRIKRKEHENNSGNN
ncbi:MAG TPA: hypothetical protein VF691_11095, partial [Cytophagaceae bacterium]